MRTRGAIDPRVKLFQILLTGFCVFFINSGIGISAEMLCLALFLCYLGVWRSAVNLLAFFAVVSALLLLIQNTPIGAVLGPVSVLLMLFRKMSPAAGIYILFTKTITVSELIAALEKLRFPKSLVLSLAVALRFVPTMRFELSAVKDALRLRGKPITLKNCLTSPLEMGECVLVPFMMRGIKVADELSASAVTRAIERPGARTSRHELRVAPPDVIYMALALISTTALLWYELAF